MLERLEQYITPEWQLHQVSTWLVLLAIFNWSSVCMELQHFHSQPVSWAINLSLSIGIQGALSTTIALLAHPLLDCCLLAAADTFLLSQYNLIIAASTLLCCIALRELTQPYQGYIKRRNRGWLPHKRAFVRSLDSWQQLIWSTTLASLCFAVLLFREQHEVHLASGTLSDVSLDDPHELNHV
jgi:hypothetical protein